MTLRRAALFFIGTSLAALAAYAQTTLPNGLTQLGNVIMMPPIPDGSTDNGFTVDRERRPSPVHALERHRSRHLHARLRRGGPRRLDGGARAGIAGP